MKVYELIQELQRRGVTLTISDDGRLKISPVSKAGDLMDEMRRKKHWLCEYAAGRYVLTPECVYETVRDAGTIYCGVLADRFPAEVIEAARQDFGVVQQCNGFFRLATEQERALYRKAAA